MKSMNELLNYQKMDAAISKEFSPAQFHTDERGHEHIIKYNPETLFNFGFMSPKGSVSSWGMGFRALIMCGAGTFVANFRCPEKATSYSFCFPILAPAEGLIFAGLVTFLLGLFVTTTFTRWWTIRERLGTMMNNTATLTMIFSQFKFEENHLQETLLKMLRYMHLSHALIYKWANKNTEFDDLRQFKLATPEELEFFNANKNANLPQVVYGWAMRCLGVLFASEKITPKAVASTSITAVIQSYEAAASLGSLIRSQMPYVYLHLITLTTKIHLSFVIFYAGGIIASGIAGSQWNRIIFGYTVIMTNFFIYEGLLIIHNVLVNPLGNDIGDFPTNLYVATNYELTLEMQQPPPIDDDETSLKGKGPAK